MGSHYWQLLSKKEPSSKEFTKMKTKSIGSPRISWLVISSSRQDLKLIMKSGISISCLKRKPSVEFPNINYIKVSSPWLLLHKYKCSFNVTRKAICMTTVMQSIISIPEAAQSSKSSPVKRKKKVTLGHYKNSEDVCRYSNPFWIS